MTYEEKYKLLKSVVRDLYFAAVWSPDRECDAANLWEDVRDAAEIEPGKSTEVLGGKR